ncbi:MAG: hypothetical protein ABGX10_11150 [Paracoccus sp. (in: a-proteobacteria)]
MSGHVSSFDIDGIVGCVTTAVVEGSSPRNGQMPAHAAFVTFLNHKITFFGIDRPNLDVMKHPTASGGFGF